MAKAAKRVAQIAPGESLVCLMYHRALEEEAFLPAAASLAEQLGIAGGVVGRSRNQRLVAGPGRLVQRHEVLR